MAPREVIERAWEELVPHLEEQGYELVEVEFGRSSGGWALRIYIDSSEGITLDDCQAVSHLLSPILDAAGFIDQGYVLEVSSPGFDRPVRKPADFERFTGERILVRTHTPVEGRKTFRGVLTGFSDGLVLVECEGAICEVHLENVLKANLVR